MGQGHAIELEGVAHHYGRAGAILENVSFTVRSGELVAIVGRSGAGKSTLLQLIAGFVRPSAGRVTLGDRAVTAPSPSCVLMFQEPSLYPWMTVAQNIAIGLELAGRRRETKERVASLLKLVQLEELAATSVQRLSGGQQQRVAFARSLAPKPEVLLLDEPFSGLDPLTRVQIQQEVRDIARRLGLTVVIVTHDFDEAIALADRVLVLAGRPARITGQLAVAIEGRRSRDTMEFRHARARLAELFHAVDDHASAVLRAAVG
jgi:NitT/TauT family transport system ATP-binding protein